MLMLGTFLAVFLVDTLNEATKDQIKAETDEYISRFQKQLVSDFEVLDIFSSMIANSSIENEESFGKILADVVEKNSFATIAYFDLSGEGTAADQGGGTWLHLPLESVQKEVQKVVGDALHGRQTVSDLFVSVVSNRIVFVYGIPVYKDGEIVGAMVASDHIEIFADILDGNGVLGGNGYLHMIESDGRFLVRYFLISVGLIFLSLNSSMKYSEEPKPTSCFAKLTGL